MARVSTRLAAIARTTSNVGAAFVLLAAGALDGSVAEAANELCGQMITESITLTADQACTGDGLIVAADAITIDLGGFTLSGDGDPGDEGILNQTASRLTIRNGTIRGFDAGIFSGLGVPAPSSLKFSHLTLRGNVTFGAVATASTFVIDQCAMLENGTGLRTEAIGSLKLTSSAFVANTTDGIQLQARSATVKNIVSTGNGGRGLSITESGAKIAVQSSLFARNGAEGVVIRDEFMDPGKITLTKSTIVGNDGTGVVVDGSADDAHHVTVTVSGNVIQSNGLHTGGLIVRNDADGTVVSGNRLIGNNGNGVRIDATSDATIVKGNIAVGNRGDGLRTENPSATFTKNVVNANFSGGIAALSGAIDGGGNTGRANGFFAPCSVPLVCPLPFTPKPGPVTPTCGMHVTSSIKLGADTPTCATDGLIVDVDGVTIDLNGHAVRGNGSTTGNGIVIPAGRTHVTVANGLVEGFQVGIGADFGSGNVKITNVEARGNLHGAILQGVGSVVSKSVFFDNAHSGIRLGDAATAAKVSTSFFVFNTEDGIVLNAPGAAFTNVVSTLNREAGVHLLGHGSGKVQGSIIAANDGDGVAVAPTAGLNLPTTLKKNVIVGNGTNGIVVAVNTVGMLLDGNVVSGNDGRGIALMSAPDQTTLKKNALAGNVSDGLFVDVAAATTAVVQTSALGNGGSGLNVDNTASTLGKNLAVGNLLSGIRTPSGAIDGGGNKAHDNIASPQCGPPIACP